MVYAMLALVIQALFLGSNKGDAQTISIPPMPNHSPIVDSAYALAAEYESGCMCDDCYWTECFGEALNEFDALFNSYETKRAKNGAMMIRRGNSGPYRFAKKG